jgi:hypothetical protein
MLCGLPSVHGFLRILHMVFRHISLTAKLATTALLFSLWLTPAQSRCYFLECEPGSDPAPPLPPPSAPPSRGPSTPSVVRPSTPYESCNRSGSITYCASSVLAPQYGFTYGPEKIADGRLDTAWVPGQGAHGDGVGEWILVQFDNPRSISTVQLLNGYRKNADIFSKNNRVREVEIVTSSGERQIYTLHDGSGPESISMNETANVEWVQLIIQSVYRGAKYRDTEISELRVQ